MRSLQQQILLLLLGALILLSGSLIIIMGIHMKDRAIAAAIIKAQSDLATATEIIDQWYPGTWTVKDGTLYKGNQQISNNNDLVDKISKLNGDTVTVFLVDTRVATTVRDNNGQRAIGTKVSDLVAQRVLKNGQQYLGEAEVVGHVYQTAYEPLHDEKGSIIGMLYVGISEGYAREMIQDSIVQMVLLGIGMTLLVGLLTWFFIQRVIIKPLKEITFGTRDVATGHITEKVEVNGPKEIGDLAIAFNLMVERLESIAGQIETVTIRVDDKTAGKYSEPLPWPEQQARISNGQVGSLLAATEHILNLELPKGLNQATLKQILNFLNTIHSPISAEEIAEGVKLTRVTVRRYLEYLEKCGFMESELKYGTVGRPVKLYAVSGQVLNV
ncbi:MAG TPA: cache domain-containing protein [Candidatus Deferrimicrobium sp.]|nr:cache domain-containing protein [Candidatus Deferrimicrobium sp.]